MKPDLQELVRYWQDRLRLRDWAIDVSYVKNLKSPSGAQVYGLCYPFLDDKRATIYIRDPEESTPLAAEPPSTEKVLVHELTHLHFAPLSGSSRAEIAAEEQAVWAISGAMVQARGTPDEPLVVRAMLARFPAPVREGGRQMAINMRAALEAIRKQDGKAALALLEQAIAGEPDGDEAPAAPDGDEAPDGEATPPGEAAPPPPHGEEKPADDKDEEKPEPAAARAPMAARRAPALPALPRRATVSPDPVVAALSAEVQRLTARDAAREAAAELAERNGLVAARPALNVKLRAMILDPTTPIQLARQMAETVAPTARLAQIGTEVVAGQPTLGEGQADAPPELPPEQAAELYRSMGILTDSAREARVDQGGQWIRPVETPTQARARLAGAQQKGS